MPQRFSLDRVFRPAYLVVSLAACTGGISPVVPRSAAPVAPAQARAWAGGTTPSGHALYRFRWLFRDDRASAGGRGSARIAAPDSIRFDARGPLGTGRMAAVVVGDSALWVEPEDGLEKLVPDYPLMWGLFGVALGPAEGVEVRGLETGRLTAWYYAAAGDTIEYALSSGERPRLVTIVRQGGRVVGKAETELGPDGRPLKARLTVPRIPARLDLTFVETASDSAFPPEIWAPGEP